MNAVWLIALMASLYLARFLWFRLRAGKAKELVAAGAALIDVRTPGEFAAGHIDGARNIPVNEIRARAAEVGPRETPVVVYCASGSRSAAAAMMLRGAGFSKVVNLGPMSAWGR
jgi:rhodanese-related sulfurtransferase